jgi:hypothetical protein
MQGSDFLEGFVAGRVGAAKAHLLRYRKAQAGRETGAVS